MIAFQFDPPLPKSPAPPASFTQTITMTDAGQTLGVARWHSPANAAAGLVQVLDLTVPPPHQRVGNGKRLLDAVIEQARELHRRRGTKLRRVWIGVEQKSQVIGRAFLTSRGFHHIATVDELYRDQELMVFVKSMD